MSEWFAGGVVAYSSQLKFDLLGVEHGPVVTPASAAQMARGAAKLATADHALRMLRAAPRSSQ